MAQARDEAGNIWEVDAQGNPVRLIQAAGGSQIPADPTFPHQGAKIQAEVGNTVANAQGQQIDNRVAGATVGAQITAANADATSKTRTAQTAGLPEGFMWGADGRTAVPIPGYTRQGLSPEIRSSAIQVYSDSEALERAADELEKLYKEGPGATKGFRGIADYLPTGTNKVFNDAGQQARGYVKRALGFTGGEGNTVAESAALYDPYLPSASDRDEQIVRKIGKLRELAADARKKAVTTLGGMPGPNGTIIPAPDEPQASAMDKIYMGGDNPLQAAPFGATEGADDYPPELKQAHDALVGRLMMQGGGRIDPRAYAQGKAELLAQFPGYAAGDPQADIAWAQGVNDFLTKGGRTVPTGMKPPERELDVAERMLTNVNTFPGAAAAGLADMGSFGAVSALAPDQMGAIAESQPEGMALGGIGGAIGGTAALGAIGRQAAGRFAPSLLGGGGRAQFARQLGTDAGYSGIYGVITDQNPLEAAAWGGAGSVAGRALGNVTGGLVGGIDAGPAIARLRGQGVTPTLGQIARGRASANGDRSLVAGVEDVIANNGAAGTFVNAARNRTLEQANLAGLRIGANGRPITEIGEDGLGQLEGHVDNTFSNALDHVNLPSNDPTYTGDMGAVRTQGAAIDAARGRGDFGYIDQNQLSPIVGGPNISGQQLQDGLRLARGQSRAYRRAATGPQPDPMAGGVADAVDGAHDALTGLAGRHYPDTIPGLNEANGMYRNLLILDDAAGRAVNEGGTWTAGQLAGAIKSNRRALGGNGGLRGQARSPLHQLQQDMAEVLPNKVPPTGVNAAPMMAIGGAALGGAGAVTDNDYLKAGGLLALAAAPYTRMGQRGVASALLDRPQAMRTAGNYINTRSGLFGRAMLPFALAPHWTSEGY